jgi:hypothetical protein
MREAEVEVVGFEDGGATTSRGVQEYWTTRRKAYVVLSHGVCASFFQQQEETHTVA